MPDDLGLEPLTPSGRLQLDAHQHPKRRGSHRDRPVGHEMEVREGLQGFQPSGWSAVPIEQMQNAVAGADCHVTAVRVDRDECGLRRRGPLVFHSKVGIEQQ